MKSTKLVILKIFDSIVFCIHIAKIKLYNKSLLHLNLHSFGVKDVFILIKRNTIYIFEAGTK